MSQIIRYCSNRRWLDDKRDIVECICCWTPIEWPPRKSVDRFLDMVQVFE